ncbi:MAG: BTAD domain-containing putative transcriptional regulator [Chloroflexota bacterium]
MKLHGNPVSGFASRKAQALLVYLVIETRPHPREELAGMLWPDYPQSSARASLRSALANVRRVIDDHHASPPHLEITRHSIQFNQASDSYLDVTLFGRLARSDSLDQKILRELDVAVAGVDDPFLAGFSLEDCPAFEEWILLKREYYHQQIGKALRHLTNHYFEKNAYEQALIYARRWIALDSWQEEAHQQVMRLLALSGKRNEALAHYRSCQRLLMEELGVEPSDETIELFEQIRANLLNGVTSQRRVSTPLQTIPRALTPLIGREQELTALNGLMVNPEIRLLTIVGPGGIGKTHLAMETALAWQSSFQHGAALVSLAALDSATGLLSAMAEALRFSFYEDTPPEQQILDYLREKQMLLVMDNFEHLLDGVGLVIKMLEEAPDLKILATSRMRLQIHGEQLYPLDGLAYPGDEMPINSMIVEKSQHRFGALTLFEQQARRSNPDFELPHEMSADVIRICRLVEGIPLAIILAAGWIEMLRPDEIANEIERNFNFLQDEQGGLPARHQNLQAVFDHTWSLLTEREQSILQKSSIFRGGFTQESAQAVMGARLSDLMALVSKFLLHRTADGRFTIHELLRQFAAQKLSQLPGRESLVYQDHSEFFSTFLQQHEGDLKSARQQQALIEIEREGENIRVAWQWAVEHGELKHLDSSINCLGTFYEWRARFHDGEASCRMATERLLHLHTGEGKRILSKLLTWQAYFNRLLGQIEPANHLVQQSLGLLSEPVLNNQDIEREKAATYLELGQQAENMMEAQEWLGQALSIYRKLNETSELAHVLYLLGSKSDHADSDNERALLLEESLKLYRSIENKRGMVNVLTIQGLDKVLQGKAIEGEDLLKQCLSICREVGANALPLDCLGILGIASLVQGKFEEARSWFSENLELCEELGTRPRMVGTMATLSHATAHLGYFGESQAIAKRALELCSDLNEPWTTSYVLWCVGAAELVEGDLTRAEESLSRSVAMHKELGWAHRGHDVMITLGFAHLQLGKLDKIQECLSDVLPLAHQTRSFITGVDGICLAAGYLANLEKPERAVELYALAQRYPYVANSHWFQRIIGPFIKVAAEMLRPETAAVAKEQGIARDLWATVAELEDIISIGI